MFLNIKHKNIGLPNKYEINDNLIIFPFSPKKSAKVEILRGPNIAPLPKFDALPPTLLGKVLLKTGDNVTTDDIMPAGARVLPFRSNVPAISEFVFEAVDQSFPTRAKDIGGGFVVGGSNYGQGSSREHAAIAPKYLGVKAVLVKSFARIHMANLINFGILPLTFINESDYQKIDQDDELEIDTSCIGEKIVLLNKTKSLEIPVTHSMSERDLNLMSAGGTLAFAAKTSSS